MKIRSNFMTNLCRNPGISKGCTYLFLPLYSDPSLSNLLNLLLQGLQPPVFLSMMPQAWHTCIWEVSPIPLCRSFQALSGWMGSVTASSGSRWVQVRALVGPLKDSQKHVPKPPLRCLGCVLRVVVLLEGKPSPPVWALWSRFSSRISLYFALLIFASILTRLPVSATEKHPHSMMLPPPCFSVGMGPGFL